MSFWENTRKPVGLGGKLMVSLMNLGHSPVAWWGLRFLNVAPDAKVLDCGCGGGANIKRLLKKCPQGIVKGIDYSPVSVEKSQKVNADAIAKGRCTILQGSVAKRIFAEGWFDAVTAFETVYFWPELPQCFHEIHRMLKPGGMFLICNESSGDTDSRRIFATCRFTRINGAGCASRRGNEKIEHGNFASGGMTMERKDAIRGAYRLTGGNNFYDGMITCSTLSGKAVCRLVWAMNKAENDAFVCRKAD